MRRKTYDAARAAALIPLLRSITNEIQEREQAIDRRTAHAQALELRHGTAKVLADVEAELAVHKREHRLALRELERLGCALDQDHPLRVLIPGLDPDARRDFTWSPEDVSIQTR